MAVSAPWQPVVPQGATEGGVYRLAQQEPDKDGTGQVIVTRRPVGQGAIVAIHGPLFRDYVIGHYPDVRAFIDGLVRRMGVEWMVEVEAPARLELVLPAPQLTWAFTDGWITGHLPRVDIHSVNAVE